MLDLVHFVESQSATGSVGIVACETLAREILKSLIVVEDVNENGYGKGATQRLFMLTTGTREGE